MKKFLKLSKGKVLLAIGLALVFIFLGSTHVVICKLPVCEALSIYSVIVSYITLWPTLIFVSASSPLLEISLFVLLPLYYYLLSCLWFYRQNDWKLKNYFLLSLAIIMIVYSIVRMYS